MEQKVLIFAEDHINKNAFHKDNRRTNIYEEDIKRIVLSNKTFIHTVTKVYLNTLLDIYIKVEFFQHHYV